MQALARKTHLSRLITVGSYIALLALLTLWYLVVHPLEKGNSWIIWLLHVLPLAAFIPTVRSGNPRGHAWLCFLLLLYFNEAVLAATTHTETRIMGVIYGLLVAVLFTSAMMYARWASQYARLKHTTENTEEPS
ncbi:DUF2069 domain-containing protein [Neptunomonas sp. XY-337]|uniref:DUF2069 domain-containing protein n=1 Tax=Neptunomonas sp. XY-337 TaxID=2561897 RepID=UPI0010AADC86|nr:DUF2069 domain-containing protein [Neptunomonas sp. XY-337]